MTSISSTFGTNTAPEVTMDAISAVFLIFQMVISVGKNPPVYRLSFFFRINKNFEMGDFFLENFILES